MYHPPTAPFQLENVLPVMERPGLCTFAHPAPLLSVYSCGPDTVWVLEPHQQTKPPLCTQGGYHVMGRHMIGRTNQDTQPCWVGSAVGKSIPDVSISEERGMLGLAGR